MGAWYTTRERVADALDIAATALRADQLDTAIESASRAIDRDLVRRFTPELATKYFEWPHRAGGNPSHILRLGYNEVISVSAVTAGADGDTMTGYNLEPNDTGPPYQRIEMDATGAGFTYGDTAQRNIAVTGLFGHTDNRTTIGTLSSQILSTATTHSAGTGLNFGAKIGVGSVVCIGSERMRCTAKAFATTGATITANLASDAGGTTVTVSSGTGLIAGAIIQVDSEQMRIVSKVSTTLTVKRAVNGTVLAAHTSGAAVSTNRSLTLARAQHGTTAATHASTTAVTTWKPPPRIEALCVATAIDQFENERAGYTRTPGTGDTQRDAAGANIPALRDLAYREFGRRSRTTAV